MGHKTLLKTSTVVHDSKTFVVRYYEWRTYKGAKRFTAELLVGPNDHPAFDGCSLEDLETRVAAALPAVLESRELLQAS